MKGEASPHRAILDILLDARRSRAFGEQTDYFDHPNTVGFTRAGDEKHPDSGLALLLSNGEDGEKVMSVGVTHANETWHEITGSYDDEIVIGDDGKASSGYTEENWPSGSKNNASRIGRNSRKSGLPGRNGIRFVFFPSNAAYCVNSAALQTCFRPKGFFGTNDSTMSN